MARDKEREKNKNSGYQAPTYQESEAVQKYRELMQAQEAARPGAYQSQWQGRMDELLKQMEERPGFRYDAANDPLFRQYLEQYKRQGKLAMTDAMGQASAMTGGYGNSYAQSVGQQTYQNYLAGATDRIPELAALAMQKYQMEGDDLRQRYGLAADRENTDYGRYRDSVTDWQNERNYATGRYDNERGIDLDRFYNDRNFDFSVWQDKKDREWQKMVWDAQQAAAAAAGSSGGGGTGPSGGDKDYEATEYMLKYGGYNSAKMLQLIRTSPLSDKQQETLIEQYQKPAQTAEVKKNNAAKDNSAYYSMR